MPCSAVEADAAVEIIVAGMALAVKIHREAETTQALIWHLAWSQVQIAPELSGVFSRKWHRRKAIRTISKRHESPSPRPTESAQEAGTVEPQRGRKKAHEKEKHIKDPCPQLLRVQLHDIGFSRKGDRHLKKHSPLPSTSTAGVDAMSRIETIGAKMCEAVRESEANGSPSNVRSSVDWPSHETSMEQEDAIDLSRYSGRGGLYTVELRAEPQGSLVESVTPQSNEEILVSATAPGLNDMADEIPIDGAINTATLMESATALESPGLGEIQSGESIVSVSMADLVKIMEKTNEAAEERARRFGVD